MFVCVCPFFSCVFVFSIEKAAQTNSRANPSLPGKCMYRIYMRICMALVHVELEFVCGCTVSIVYLCMHSFCLTLSVFLLQGLYRVVSFAATFESVFCTLSQFYTFDKCSFLLM